MSAVTLDVYLYFRGDCQEAMKFYQGIFGGELETQDYATVPGMENSEHPNWLMHARLEGGDIKLMASDTEKASDKTAKVSLALGGTDETKMRDIFAKLSEGGSVFSELKKEFWGDTFGSLTDKYGVEWMMNIAAPAES